MTRTALARFCNAGSRHHLRMRKQAEARRLATNAYKQGNTK